jgi:hypothetical protein
VRLIETISGPLWKEIYQNRLPEEHRTLPMTIECQLLGPVRFRCDLRSVSHRFQHLYHHHFRLWHYLAYTVLVALELANYLRWQE